MVYCHLFYIILSWVCTSFSLQVEILQLEVSGPRVLQQRGFRAHNTTPKRFQDLEYYNKEVLGSIILQQRGFRTQKTTTIRFQHPEYYNKEVQDPDYYNKEVSGPRILQQRGFRTQNTTTKRFQGPEYYNKEVSGPRILQLFLGAILFYGTYIYIYYILDIVFMNPVYFKFHVKDISLQVYAKHAMRRSI